MNTYLKYGVAIPVAGLIAMVLCYVSGLWDVDNLGKGLIIGTVVAIGIHTFGIVLGTRVERAPSGAAGFSYGKAFKVGFMISLVSAVAGIACNAIFFKFINPNYNETTIAWTRSLMENMKAPEAQIEKAEEQMRAKAGLTRQLVNGVVGAIVIGTIISLITAAVMKRPPADDLTGGPPAIS